MSKFASAIMCDFDVSNIVWLNYYGMSKCQNIYAMY